MDNNCQIVVFSDKAYNAIIRETFEWEPVETGGILLGHVLDNGCWIVMEVLPPGYGEGREGDNVFHEMGYFEYNRKFVNYLAKSVAEQYEIPLELLGLWHRHPGSLDRFSGTDDGTNATFAAQNQNGVISGLINVDPKLRLTMYYLSHSDVTTRRFGRLNYQRVQVEVGSDLIPEQYFKLRYYQGDEADLHPLAPQRANNRLVENITEPPSPPSSDNQEQIDEKPIDAQKIVKEQIERKESSSEESSIEQKPLSAISDFTEFLKKNKKPIILIIAIVAFIFSIISIKNDFAKLINGWNSKQNPPIEHLNSHSKQNETNSETIVDNAQVLNVIEGDSLDKGNSSSDKDVSSDMINSKEHL